MADSECMLMPQGGSDKPHAHVQVIAFHGRVRTKIWSYATKIRSSECMPVPCLSTIRNRLGLLLETFLQL